MGKSEDKKSIKTEKGSSTSQEPANIHLYPDWMNIQAYYGPGVPLPPPYFNPAVTASHVPHLHVWAPQQPLMPPYGVPCSTIYSPGVVYAHPAAPLVATPLIMELLSKSSENVGQSSTKKLKRLDGLAVPISNDSAEVDAEGSVHEASQSVDGIDASGNGSDGNTGAHPSQRRSDSMGTLSIECDGKVHAQATTKLEGEANITSNRVSGINVAAENVQGNSMGSPNGKSETSGLPFEVWVQDERQLKRERRKQANRESARRSRLRKQAEIEELMKRYETLKVENLTLKSELNQLTEDSEKVRLENAALVGKLNNAQE